MTQPSTIEANEKKTTKETTGYVKYFWQYCTNITTTYSQNAKHYSQSPTACFELHNPINLHHFILTTDRE